MNERSKDICDYFPSHSFYLGFPRIITFVDFDCNLSSFPLFVCFIHFYFNSIQCNLLQLIWSHLKFNLILLANLRSLYTFLLLSKLFKVFPHFNLKFSFKRQILLKTVWFSTKIICWISIYEYLYWRINAYKTQLLNYILKNNPLV